MSDPSNTSASKRPCPLCSTDRYLPFLKKDNLQLVRCTHCSMVYAHAVPPDLSSGRGYEDRAYTFYLSPDKLESDYAPVRFERELNLFRSFCPRGNVLDVGCSTGAFLYQLTTRYQDLYQVSGTDVAIAALDHARQRGIPILGGCFPELDFGQEGFDAITFWAVLEHLASPGSYLEAASRLLNPGGHCFILVPNLRSLAVRLLKQRYRYIMPEHLNYFDRTTLRQFVQVHGHWQILQEGSTHFNPMVLAQDLTAKPTDGPVTDTQRARLLKRTTAWKQRRALLPFRGLYQLCESLLAKFNLADNLIIVLRK